MKKPIEVSPLYKTLISLLDSEDQKELALELIAKLRAIPIVASINVLFEEDLERMAQELGGKND